MAERAPLDDVAVVVVVRRLDQHEAKTTNTMWGGRFDEAPDAILQEINASIDFDRGRLPRQDIRRLRAPTPACSPIKASFRRTMRNASSPASIRSPPRSPEGPFPVLPRARRHPHECRVAPARADRPDPAGRLDTARSRNDQVATDFPPLGARRHRRGSTASHAPPCRTRPRH